jgi:hypothetical protein
MKIKSIAFILALTLGANPANLLAQEKVQLEEPKQPDLLAELKDAPDGVLKLRTNENGAFKSLLVKARVEIEDVLGAQKGKVLARKEAEVQCKGYLAKWLNENCVFVEASNKTVTIQTRGESAKDAQGNTVKIRSQQGQDVKILTESHASKSQAALKGLIVVSSDVTKNGEEFVLIMGLTEKSLNQSSAVADALAGKATRPANHPANTQDTDRPATESKVNREALDDFR